MLAEQLHIARPGAHRRFGGQQRCAGHRARHDREQSAAVFVRIGRRHRQMRPRRETGRDRSEVEADRNQPPRAHRGHRGHQSMGLLPCPQRQRHIVLRQRAEHFAAIACHCARYIYCYSITVSCINLFKQSGKYAFDLPRQAVTEQAIDHDRMAHRRIGRNIPAKLRPRLARGIGGRLDRRNQLHRVPVSQEGFGDHIAITAIVARPAQHRHRSSRGDPHDPLRRALARALHQFPFAGPRSHRRAFGGAHLRDCEDRLIHRAVLPSDSGRRQWRGRSHRLPARSRRAALRRIRPAQPVYRRGRVCGSRHRDGA